MPKSVFYKISKDRQMKLLKPAVVEFTKKNYEKVTVLSLTDTMKILRTDFYYYFQDKEDVYNYLMEEFKIKIVEKAPEHNLPSAFTTLFLTLTSMRGPRNRQYLIDLTENYNPQFAHEFASRLAEIYPCGCNPNKKHAKVMGMIYNLMTVTNMYLKGDLEQEMALELISGKKKCEE